MIIPADLLSLRMYKFHLYIIAAYEKLIQDIRFECAGTDSVLVYKQSSGSDSRNSGVQQLYLHRTRCRVRQEAATQSHYSPAHAATAHTFGHTSAIGHRRQLLNLIIGYSQI